MPRFKAARTDFCLNHSPTGQSFTLFRCQGLCLDRVWNTPIYFNPKFDGLSAAWSGLDPKYGIAVGKRCTIELYDPSYPVDGPSIHPVNFLPMYDTEDRDIKILLSATELLVEFDFEYDKGLPLNEQGSIYLVAKDTTKCRPCGKKRGPGSFPRVYRP